MLHLIVLTPNRPTHTFSIPNTFIECVFVFVSCEFPLNSGYWFQGLLWAIFFVLLSRFEAFFHGDAFHKLDWFIGVVYQSDSRIAQAHSYLFVEHLNEQVLRLPLFISKRTTIIHKPIRGSWKTRRSTNQLMYAVFWRSPSCCSPGAYVSELSFTCLHWRFVWNVYVWHLWNGCECLNGDRNLSRAFGLIRSRKLLGWTPACDNAHWLSTVRPLFMSQGDTLISEPKQHQERVCELETTEDPSLIRYRFIPRFEETLQS